MRESGGTSQHKFAQFNKGSLASKMVGAGHRVVFDPEGSYIEDIATYERMSLKERNGMYFLSLWTKASARGF